MNAKRRSYRPQVEALEAREVPAYINMAAGGIIQAVGDDGMNDSVHAYVSGSQVVVHMESTPTNGGQTTVIEQRFAKTSAHQIRFWGYGGNDTFINDSSIASMAWGGAGNDYLAGSSAADQFFGGDGNDTLMGNGGNDLLYGESGDDFLVGGAGADQLYGGAGHNRYQDDWSLFIGGASMSDVKQGTSGGCTILAGLADTTAHNLAGRGNWAGRIRNDGNGQFEVLLYSSASSAGGTAYWQRTTFDGTWTDDDARPTQVNGVNEVWTIIAQRATLDSYGVPWRATTFDTGAWGTWWCDNSVALQRLTGYTTYRQYSYDGAHWAQPQDLQARLNGYFVTAGTVAQPTSSLIVGGHAYAVLNVHQSGGYWYVDLYNPWGVDGGAQTYGADDGRVTIDWSSFCQSFWSYDFA